MRTIALLCCMITALLVGCNGNNKTPGLPGGNDSVSINDTSLVKGLPCDVRIAGVHFTKSINGADSLVKVNDSGKVIFRVGAQKDYFSDPNDDKLSNKSAPILLSKVDNTKPFTFISKVTPAFTAAGTYNAGVLYLYVNDDFWQKMCFEQDERGNHRMVTVRTIGTSDDNNHDVVTAPSVYMKISSDTRTVAFYYSLDQQSWQLVRLYKNNYPASLWLGISAQSPVADGSQSDFENIGLLEEAVKDFRLGE